MCPYLRVTPVPDECRGRPTSPTCSWTPTKGPMWGYPRFVLGAIGSFLEPFCGHLSPKLDKVSEELTLRYPHKGPWVVQLPSHPPYVVAAVPFSVRPVTTPVMEGPPSTSQAPTLAPALRFPATYHAGPSSASQCPAVIGGQRLVIIHNKSLLLIYHEGRAPFMDDTAPFVDHENDASEWLPINHQPSGFYRQESSRDHQSSSNDQTIDFALKIS